MYNDEIVMNMSEKKHGGRPWVVIPTYNERMNVARMIETLLSLGLDNLSVLIVDDNSPDGTYRIVEDYMERNSNVHLLKREKKDGLGGAYIAGFKHAIAEGATEIVQMDADFSHDPKDVPMLIGELRENDLVVGSRYCNGISVINWPMRRLLLSTFANMYAAFVTGLPVKDITGGFRAWRPAVLEKIKLDEIKVDGYGFQVVMVYRAWKNKARIKEVPIIFTERREGQSKMSKAIVFEAVWLVWKLRFFG